MCAQMTLVMFVSSIVVVVGMNGDSLEMAMGLDIVCVIRCFSPKLFWCSKLAWPITIR
jgi:hypothetical protein